MVANRLVDAIEQQIDNGIVGIAIAVVAGDEVLWSDAFGLLDIDRPAPITTRSAVPIQSVSKSVVATALMHWVEQGTVALDDPVNRHLGDVRVANEWEARSPITIRRLLTHTAGLPVSIGPGTAPSLEDQVAQVASETEPGTRMMYANSGYDVLGYLLGCLAETTWDRAVRDVVLGPLDMTATTTERVLDDEQAVGHAVSQLDGTRLRLSPSAWAFEPPPPSGGLISNVEDLARLLIAHLADGGGVLARGTVADMHRCHAPLGNGGSGMGLGFRVDQRSGRSFFCHAGDGSGFTTFIGGHPEELVGVVLLMNTGGAQEARSVIVRAALDSVLDAAPPVTGGPAPARPPTGGYRSTDWGVRVDVAEVDGVPVVSTAPGLISFGTSVSRLSPRGARWQADGGMFDGWELDFETTADHSRKFYGGVYAFEFVADDTRPIGLPHTVDDAGELGGMWVGTTDTPLGPIPLELDLVVAEHAVTVTVLGAVGVDRSAETSDGWLRAQLDLDLNLVGLGDLTVFVRLGLVDARLEGMLYVRSDAGELCFPTVLEQGAFRDDK